VKCGPAIAVQYSLETLFLIVTALAAYLALLIALPPLGLPMMAIGLPALVRTIALTTRELHRGKEIALAEKLDAYRQSLLVTFAAAAAFTAVLGGGTTLLWASASLASQSQSYVFDFACAATGVLGCLACLLVAVPLFHCIYWQSLPPATSSKFQVQS
jgi:hypothetical protein